MTLKKISKLHIYAEVGSASVDRDPDGRNTHRVRQVFCSQFIRCLAPLAAEQRVAALPEKGET
jgi:hypothetical protein